MDIKTIIGILSGGFAGGVVRYWLSIFLNANGIFIANLIGCFLLAFLTYYVIEKKLLANWLNAAIGTGFIGALTTFSSLITTTINLSRDSSLHALGYLLASACGGLLMAGLGFLCAGYLGKKGSND